MRNSVILQISIVFFPFLVVSGYPVKLKCLSYNFQWPEIDCINIILGQAPDGPVPKGEPPPCRPQA